ncbi:MAG: hypothetical protein ACK4TA_02970 [Saprospiraceae bacterium]
MVNAAELKVKIFRLVDAQDGETLEELYQLLLARLKAKDQWASDKEGDAGTEEPEEEVRHFYAQTDALSFWEDEREDLYQDYLDQKPQ